MKKFELNKPIKNLKENIKNNQNKFGKNFPYKAWLPENVSVTSSDDKLYVCKGKPDRKSVV